MSLQQPIFAGIQGLLANNSNVTATVSTRIYDSHSPQDPTLPMIIVGFVSDPPQVYFSLEDLGPLEFQVDIYGKLEGGTQPVRSLGDVVYSVLHRGTFTASGYSGLSILCTDRGGRMEEEMITSGRTQQDASRVVQTYKVFGTGTS